MASSPNGKHVVVGLTVALSFGCGSDETNGGDGFGGSSAFEVVGHHCAEELVISQQTLVASGSDEVVFYDVDTAEESGPFAAEELRDISLDDTGSAIGVVPSALVRISPTGETENLVEDIGALSRAGAVDSQFAYLGSDYIPGIPMNGVVVRVPLSGGVPEVLGNPEHYPWRLGQDASSLWFATSSAIYRVAKDGSDLEQIDINLPENTNGVKVLATAEEVIILCGPAATHPVVVFDKTSHELRTVADYAADISKDANHLYYADYAGVSRMSLSDLRIGNWEAVITDSDDVTSVTVGGGHVYWAARTSSGAQECTIKTAPLPP